MKKIERTENYNLESKLGINGVAIVKVANMFIKIIKKVIRIMYIIYIKCILMYISQLKSSVFNSTFSLLSYFISFCISGIFYYFIECIWNPVKSLRWSFLQK